MSTLNHTEKRKLEDLLGMGTGYVLDFSNRTFAEFITDYSGRNIYDSGYEYGSGSKANRLRKFWQGGGRRRRRKADERDARLRFFRQSGDGTCW